MISDLIRTLFLVDSTVFHTTVVRRGGSVSGKQSGRQTYVCLPSLLSSQIGISLPLNVSVDSNDKVLALHLDVGLFLVTSRGSYDQAVARFRQFRILVGRNGNNQIVALHFYFHDLIVISELMMHKYSIISDTKQIYFPIGVRVTSNPAARHSRIKMSRRGIDL